MAVQFGRWECRGQASRSGLHQKGVCVNSPLQLEAAQLYSVGGISMVYCAFPTTTESCSDFEAL